MYSTVASYVCLAWLVSIFIPTYIAQTIHRCVGFDDPVHYRCPTRNITKSTRYTLSKHKPLSPCEPSTSWCNAASGTKWPQWVCPQYENYHSDSCFSWNFTLAINKKVYDYFLVRVATSWLGAESFCQERGFHLVSLASQREANEITNKLYYLNNNPGIWAQRTTNLRDPMGYLASFTGQKYIPYSWKFSTYLGLYRSEMDNLWHYTDGAVANLDITVGQRRFRLRDSLNASITKSEAVDGQSGSNTADENTQVGQPRELKWLIWETDYAKGIFRSAHQELIPTIGHFEAPNAILCKRPHPADAAKGLEPDPGLLPVPKCITGYQCPKSSKCLVGNPFRFPQLCDGKRDCPDGEDEDAHTCEFEKVVSVDGKRLFLLSPLVRPIIDTIEYCRSKNWTLPNLESAKDKENLRKKMIELTRTENGGFSAKKAPFVLHSDDGSQPVIPLSFIQGLPSADDGTELGAFSKITYMDVRGSVHTERLLPGTAGVMACETENSGSGYVQSGGAVVKFTFIAMLTIGYILA